MRGSPVAVGALLAAVMLMAACKDKARPPPSSSAPPPPRAADPLAALHWDTTPLDWTRPIAHIDRAPSGAAGAEACKPCHEQIYASYARHSMARTGMRRIEAVDPRWIGPLFDQGTTVVHARSGFSYRPLRRGARYFVAESVLGTDGAPLATWEEPVTHVFSAGSYGLALYSQRGDHLIHLPIDYYAKAARWDLDPMAFGGNPRLAVGLDTFCISCHSDEPARRFTDPLPHGISCERCHGPSERHVATLDPKDTIGPAHLPARRQLELCAQCHQSTSPILRDGRDHFGYHPGEPLDAFRVNFLVEPAETDRVKLLDHAERLVRSACWRGARDKLTCTTCHDPHTSSLEQPEAWWDGKCLQCHARTACTDTREHRAAMGDHCPRCHMRSGTTSNVPLVAITDHWIQTRAPPIRPGANERTQRLVTWSAAIGEPVDDPGMPAILALGHADAGLGDEAVRRAALAITKRPSAPLYELLASAYIGRRQLPLAGRAYQTALRLAPDAGSALLGYARVMFDLRTPETTAEAVAALRRMLELDPTDVAALETLAIHLYRTGDRSQAIALFRRAAATDRASGISFVALANDDAPQRTHWLELAWRAEPRDRWVLDQLADDAAAAKDPARIAEIARRRVGLGIAVNPTPASAWLPRSAPR